MDTVLHHSAGIVVFIENEQLLREYLLLKYPGGHWDFVKGHIEEQDSDLKETATRELLEETGIGQVEFIDGFEEVIHYDYEWDNKLHKKRVDFFLGKVDPKFKDLKNLILSEEHTEFLWLPFEEALEKTTFDNARNVLQASEEFLLR